KSGNNRPRSSKEEIVQESAREDKKSAPKAIDKLHQAFFDDKQPTDDEFLSLGVIEIPVLFDGQQVVRENSRLRMRLQKKALIDRKVIPRNTLVYGFVSLQPNRLSVTIEHIDQISVALKAYDFEDGHEGIYIENNLRADVQNEVLDDALGGLTLP